MSPKLFSLIQVLSFYILPFPHWFSVARWFLPLEFHHILTLKFPGWRFEMQCSGEKDQEHILHINWSVISETNKRPGNSWPFEIVKTWPFLEGCSSPPTIGDQKVTVWNRLRVIVPTRKTMHDIWCKALKDTICSGNFMIPVISSYLFLGGPTKMFR